MNPKLLFPCKHCGQPTRFRLCNVCQEREDAEQPEWQDDDGRSAEREYLRRGLRLPPRGLNAFNV